MTKELIERLRRNAGIGTGLEHEAADAIEALQKQVSDLEAAVMYQQQYTEPDDVMFTSIENAARTSFRRHVYSARGQQLTRSDGYESHLVWAAQAQIKVERDALADEVAALKRLELIDLHQANQELLAELAAARAQEPVSYRYKFTHPISGEPVWRDSSPTWNGQCVQEVQPLFAAPVPPVREPLSDAQINEIRLVHGVTSSGRGIREVAQVISFARAIEAAIKEQK